MKQFINPIVIAIVLVSVLDRHVKCIASSKTTSGLSSSEGSQPQRDLKTDGSSLWSPQPEYYDRDRYNRPDRPDRTDFITSYGSFENKYGGSSLPSSSSSTYGNKDRYSPFSTGSNGAYYTSGGIYDHKQLPYGPVDYQKYAHDYENHYDYPPHGHLGQSSSGKDLAKSVLIPLAGAALLGIAAALVANPVLLHLGAVAGKRKRRDVTANAHNLAYRAHLKETLEAPPASPSA